MDAYDVIIVGTGAGGGTLARHLAPSGKRILLIERGDWLPREPENWLAQNVFVENRYVSPETWYDANGKAFQPQIHYFVGGRDEALRRCALPSADRGLRRASPSRRDLARVADLLRRARAVLHAGRAALRGARSPGRGSDRAAGQCAVPVPGAVARAADPAARRRSRGGRLPPVPRAVRRAAERGEHAVQHLRALHELRRLPLRRARKVGRGGARCPAGARAPERDAADERDGPSSSRRIRRGTNVTEVVVEHDGETRTVHRRRLRRRLRCGKHRQAAAQLRERQASERARQRLGPGRPQLHVPQQPGRPRALA